MFQGFFVFPVHFLVVLLGKGRENGLGFSHHLYLGLGNYVKDRGFDTISLIVLFYSLVFVGNVWWLAFCGCRLQDRTTLNLGVHFPLFVLVFFFISFLVLICIFIYGLRFMICLSCLILNLNLGGQTHNKWCHMRKSTNDNYQD